MKTAKSNLKPNLGPLAQLELLNSGFRSSSRSEFKTVREEGKAFADYYQSPDGHADLGAEDSLAMSSFAKHYQNPAGALQKTLRVILEIGGQALDSFARHYQRPQNETNRGANNRMRRFLKFSRRDIGSFAEHYQKPSPWRQMQIGTF